MDERALVFGVLIALLGLFVWGRWRYDLVALLGLLVVSLAGVISPSAAFSGFGEPAVVTVAAVLVVSKGLQNAGLVDMMARWVSLPGKPMTMQIAALTGVATVMSAFMNNVGALALMMPVAIRIGTRNGIPLSQLLMPLAFGSLLGGMMTLIGTPPNILIANYRSTVGGEPFSMFDFARVGAGIAVAGVVFMTFIGWRLIPRRKGASSADELFQIKNYIAEVRVLEESKLAGHMVREVESATDAEVQVLALVRGEHRMPVFGGYETLQNNDVLIVEAGPEALKELLEATNLDLVGSQDIGEKSLSAEDVSAAEAVVMPDSSLVGRTAAALHLRRAYGVNLIAVARRGAVVQERLSQTRFLVGDVLLLQGRTDR